MCAFPWVPVSTQVARTLLLTVSEIQCSTEWLYLKHPTARWPSLEYLLAYYAYSATEMNTIMVRYVLPTIARGVRLATGTDLEEIERMHKHPARQRRAGTRRTRSTGMCPSSLRPVEATVPRRPPVMSSAIESRDRQHDGEHADGCPHRRQAKDAVQQGLATQGPTEEGQLICPVSDGV